MGGLAVCGMTKLATFGRRKYVPIWAPHQGRPSCTFHRFDVQFESCLESASCQRASCLSTLSPGISLMLAPRAGGACGAPQPRIRHRADWQSSCHQGPPEINPGIYKL